MPLLLLTISTLLTLAGFLSKYGWYFDLASHFRVQYLAIQILCIILCIFKKRKKLMYASSIFALINILCILPLYVPVQKNQNIDEVMQKKLSILLINVNSSNTNYADTIEYINKINPDILALEEINDNWLNALKSLLENYNYYEEIPRGDNFGIGLYSKIPPKDLTIKYYGNADVPSIKANFIFNEELISLLFTHPVPPASLNYFKWRNEQLESIVLNRSDFSDTMIVVGDLNTTSWSYYFQNFCKKMNLVDSRNGFGLQTTWPTMMPPMSITIDHILISDKIKVIQREIGQNIGSDHLPVYIELLI